MTLVISIVAVGLALFFGALVWRLKREEQSRSAARVVALGEAIDDVTATAPVQHVDVQPAFLEPARPGASPGGIVKLAIGVAMVTALVVAAASLGTSLERRAPSGEPASAAASDGSLELLSMRHERQPDALTVTGLVRNAGARPAERLIAVIFAFDRSGNFIASGRAPLEFLTMAPGDESPFRVSVPVTGDVGRYRVSFRTESGVVRHVDRRQALMAHRTE